MKSDTTDPERQAFKILELIDTLRDSPWCQSSVIRSPNIETLLDELEDSYRFAMEPWAEHRVVSGELAQEDFYRWHEYMFPPDIYQEARQRFTELVTTSRFSVEEDPRLSDLEQVNSPSDKITKRHIVSLAVLVCIQFALEEIESFEFLDAQNEAELFVEKIEAARGLRIQADLWLSHLATLNLTKRDFDIQRKTEQAKRKKQPVQAAKGFRKAETAAVTPELIAQRFQERPKDKKWQTLQAELAEEFGVSPSIIYKRFQQAKR